MAAEAAVRVWTVDLHPSVDELAELETLLSADERERAARFHFPRDRDRYVSCRGSLRRILGAAVDRPPASLAFAYGPNGKPELVGAAELEFNVSHSGGLALVAVARGRRVGVDVEEVVPERAAWGLAERYFSPAERQGLRTLSPADRPAGFFRCWTSKEALVKGLGSGLSLPLDSFDVAVDPAAPAAVVAARPPAEAAAGWGLRDARVPAGFAAAVAAEGSDWELVAA